MPIKASAGVPGPTPATTFPSPTISRSLPISPSPSANYETRTYTRDNDRDITYSEVTLVPGVSYRFNPHLSADLYLNLLQIAYTHTTLIESPQAEPADKASADDKVTFSSFTFGNNISNLINLAMGGYGGSNVSNISTFRIGINYTF